MRSMRRDKEHTYQEAVKSITTNFVLEVSKTVLNSSKFFKKRTIVLLLCEVKVVVLEINATVYETGKWM